MKKIIILILAVSTFGTANAQQDAQFTHYSFNTLAVNPGYAGSREALTVTGLHRSQWVSFPGAPQSSTITAHAPVFNEKIGLGFSLVNDIIGPTHATGFNIDIAYKLRIGEQGKLSIGLKAGANLRSNRLGTEVETVNKSDQSFSSNIQSDFLPNFGFGLYYANPKFYVGVSTPKLLQNDFETNGTANIESNEQRHFYFIAGAIFSLNQSNTIKIKPTTFVRYTNGASMVVDLTALFYFNDKYWAGPMFRTTDALGILAGMNLTDQFSFGYSFDWSYANKTSVYNAGSHELMLRYDFIFKKTGNILSPRYF